MANLLHVYEFYLLATFALGLLQVRSYFATLRFVLRAPGRWPELTRVLKENLNVLLAWPLVVVGGVTAGLWTTHVLMRRVVWPDAVVDSASVRSDMLWLVLLGFTASLMLILDTWSLVRAARYRPPRAGAILTATDLALRFQPTRAAMRLFVGWRVRTKMVATMPVVLRWTLRRTAELGARLSVGFVLWTFWLLHRAA